MGKYKKKTPGEKCIKIHNKYGQLMKSKRIGGYLYKLATPKGYKKNGEQRKYVAPSPKQIAWRKEFGRRQKAKLAGRYADIHSRSPYLSRAPSVSYNQGLPPLPIMFTPNQNMEKRANPYPKATSGGQYKKKRSTTDTSSTSGYV